MNMRTPSGGGNARSLEAPLLSASKACRRFDETRSYGVGRAVNQLGLWLVDDSRDLPVTEWEAVSDVMLADRHGGRWG